MSRVILINNQTAGNNKKKIFQYKVETRHATDQNFQLCEKEFRNNFAVGVELGAQLTIYHKGKVVVDLAGKVLEKPYKPEKKTNEIGDKCINNENRELMATIIEYSHQSLQTVYSSTKNLTAMCVAKCVEKGHFLYNDKVCKHWPEFGNNGKENITIADVLRHDAGLFRFHRQGKPKDVMDQKKMFKLIEDSPLNYFKSVHTPRPESFIAPPADGKRRGYHGVSRGCILGCLIQKVDGRELQQFFKEEIVNLLPEKLNGNVYISQTEEEQKKHHFADMAPYQSRWCQTDPDIGLYLGGGKMAKFAKENQRDGSIFLMNSVSFGFPNSVMSRALTIGSASGTCNAFGLGTLAAVMAGKGTLNGVQILSEETYDLAHSAITQKYDDVLLEEERFAQGGFAEFRLTHLSRETSEGRGSLIGGANNFGLEGSFYGWGGSGGSAFCWSPEYEIGFAYTMNGMASFTLGGPRTTRIFNGLFESLKQMGYE